MSIAIITDSSAYLSPQTVARAGNIYVTPIAINWDNNTFYDMRTLQPKQFYDQLAKRKALPTTSMPSMGTITQLLDDLAEEGITDVIILPMSKGISSFTSALSVVADQTMPRVHVVDTNSTCGGMEMLVLLASRLANEGFEITDILAAITTLQHSMQIEFIVKDLNYLKRTGRISTTSQVLGNLLRVRPILAIDTQDTGIIRPIGKERTAKRAIRHIEDDLTASIKAAPKLPYAAVVFDGNAPEEKRAWLHHLKETFTDVRFSAGIIGPGVGCHTGGGVLAMAWAYDWQVLADQLISERAQLQIQI
ncbi:DegV family protein [Secundilactobacillus paracollinoides]|uniref:Fatty acid-binding protein DegV n=1 Tax=Secundilactobacillus paracollinoides TaxID=240427 RepID=A0A1B2J0X5_9LACO|nr:DegV family protein [Secundilactobacillus paracollinoides]ANZ62041.1 hypothetical protein AYR61_12220 [Secundilactobacillus paracollinoides]ANZ67986.1 hypothetical protein AYR63_13110 [Secundilactobacillus paracollinoides]KRL76557.1 hypothetical protein FC17_GL002062 [Secundilactobacillus paracollinoides DSM 15502 = JCM 11969]